ncbi:hypothetical protein CDD82_6575 [Ophiocordyceps australis]|uniref:Arrestin C-terminal-like domain-containing protein n=1 Tax=Ophiocordyceps australis TaxID=1399860 RepID=A0A2C5ZQH6_9HYPO|nr:hypothetical protein CDD82_6575 [Ophiocordyceps australis]
MPFKPFASVTGRNSYSLFDIRLDNDFLVFRGNEHESSGQQLKGVVVLCLSSSLRIEDVRLRLTGTLRQTISAPGVSGQKVDKTTTILDHRWAPFVGAHGKSITLPAGNYEYPFEYTLPGDTAESVEGIPEASITYRLKATVGRSKLAYDLHAYKHLRIIRTLEPGALEFLHAMSVENIWPNKVDYSIIVPQKAVVFGGTMKLEMRFTPLLKGLELGEISVKLLELRDCWIQGSTGLNIREHHAERDVATWRFEVNRQDHWQDMIEDTGQEGWALTKPLALPKRLRQCIQDLNHHGIKVRHKIKLTVALKNPDGHISELRATLPVSIFISPNVPFDEDGNLVSQAPGAISSDHDAGAIAPPGYGEHVLDQLFENVESAGGYQTPGFQTPGFHTPGMQTPCIQSDVSSPLYAHSRAGSADNLAAMAHSAPVAPAALLSRLADVSLDSSRRNSSYTSIYSISGRMSPPQGGAPGSGGLTRRNSDGDDDNSGRNSIEHIDSDDNGLADLSRVPSYATAVRSRTQTGTGPPVPDYQTALNAPRTPPTTEVNVEHLAPISEDASGEGLAMAATQARALPVDLVMTRAHSDDVVAARREVHMSATRASAA